MTESFLPLQCLGGAGAPDELRADLRRLADFPDDAREQIWDVLGLALNERLPPDIDARGMAFSEAHDIPPQDVASVLRAYRMLLRNAFLQGAPPKALADDLELVGGESARGEKLRASILPGYPAAKALLEQEASGGAIADHGATLVDVDWRLDRVVASTRGDANDALVAMLTFTLHDGAESRRVTVQALPDVLERLEVACSRIRAAASKGPPATSG